MLIKTLVLGGGLAMAMVLTPAGAAWAMDYRAVFTTPPQRIPSDNSVDAPLLGNGDTLAAIGGTPDKLRFYINKNDLWITRAGGGSHPIPLARLELDFPALQGASYRVEQDLQQAITTGRFTQAGVTLSLETSVAATENLLWIKLSAEGGALQGRAGLYLPGQDAAATGDVAVVERRFEQDVLVPAGAACAMRVVGGGREFTVTPGKPVLIFASVCSRLDHAEFRQAAVRRASELGPEELDRVRAAHVAWWRQFWARSFVEITDKVLEQRYYLSHYVLASASRVRDFPPGLFGWITTDKPNWNGDYHLNYNHVAPFYGLYAANHVEQADPCHGPILAALNMGHEWSLKHFGITNGVLLPVGIGPKGSLADENLWGQKSNAGYCCVPLALRWYSTYDLDFGKQAYPFVRDTARFWEESLALENGRYVIRKDAVHEGSGENVNPIQTLGLLKQVMKLALDMSSELGVDAGRRAKWMDIRDRLSDYPTCKVRNLPKEFLPKHLPLKPTLDLPIFRYTEKGPRWWGDNTLGIQHIYPAGGIGLDSKPELLQRARNQIRVMNRWMDFNGMNSFYAAAARVGYDPTVILKEMRNMLGKWALPNGMIRDNPHFMEHQSIVPNAIQEMLLQSHDGVLRLFPCWSHECGNARFGTLRARGAFLVSAEIRNGTVYGVKVVSEKGRSCTMVNPWPGNKVQLVRNGRNTETLMGARFTFNTSVNDTFELRPEDSL